MFIWKNLRPEALVKVLARLALKRPTRDMVAPKPSPEPVGPDTGAGTDR